MKTTIFAAAAATLVVSASAQKYPTGSAPYPMFYPTGTRPHPPPHSHTTSTSVVPPPPPPSFTASSSVVSSSTRPASSPAIFTTQRGHPSHHIYITKTVTEFPTACPSDHGVATYTVTEATTITITEQNHSTPTTYTPAPPKSTSSIPPPPPPYPVPSSSHPHSRPTGGHGPKPTGAIWYSSSTTTSPDTYETFAARDISSTPQLSRRGPAPEIHELERPGFPSYTGGAGVLSAKPALALGGFVVLVMALVALI